MDHDKLEDALEQMQESILTMSEIVPPVDILKFIDVAERTGNFMPLDDSEEATRALIRIITMYNILMAYWLGRNGEVFEDDFGLDLN